MKIVYKQPSSKNDALYLSELGISQCNFNYVSCVTDRQYITSMRHQHSGIEIHILLKGNMEYEFENKTVSVESGAFLLIPPGIGHRILSFSEDCERASLHFFVSDNCKSLFEDKKLVVGKTPTLVFEGIRFVLEEKQNRSPMYVILMENRILECIVLLLREAYEGLYFAEREHFDDRDPRFLLAEQYIKDNIKNQITVSELSSYCSVSTKQLSRIFMNETGMNASEYIRKERCNYLQKLVTDTDLTFKEISEMMNFASEYHFNSFFKKYSGLSPGVYRKVRNCSLLVD